MTKKENIQRRAKLKRAKWGPEFMLILDFFCIKQNKLTSTFSFCFWRRKNKDKKRKKAKLERAIWGSKFMPILAFPLKNIVRHCCLFISCHIVSILDLMPDIGLCYSYYLGSSSLIDASFTDHTIDLLLDRFNAISVLLWARNAGGWGIDNVVE